MTKISMAIATYNEEKNLKTCLESVLGWVDEIVLVDGGSTDNTVDIAKEFKAKVIITDNPPIFHINKQKALDKCKGEWILQLDADEVVPSELKNEIIEIVGGDSKNTPYDGYYMPRKNYFLWHWMRKGGQYPDYLIRFFKNGKGSFPQKSVHEQIVIHGSLGYLKTPLEHRPYKSYTEYWKKAHTYADLVARDMALSGVQVTFGVKLEYTVSRPLRTFLSLFIRHKGFMDGIFGFLFALFSAYQHILAIKKYQIYAKEFN